MCQWSSRIWKNCLQNSSVMCWRSWCPVSQHVTNSNWKFGWDDVDQATIRLPVASRTSSQQPLTVSLFTTNITTLKGERELMTGLVSNWTFKIWKQPLKPKDLAAAKREVKEAETDAVNIITIFLDTLASWEIYWIEQCIESIVIDEYYLMQGSPVSSKAE